MTFEPKDGPNSMTSPRPGETTAAASPRPGRRFIIAAVLFALAAGLTGAGHGPREATAEAQFRIAVPGLASDPAAAQPIPPPGTAGVVSTAHGSVSRAGITVASGEIRNGLDRAITDVMVTGTARTPSGTLLAERTVPALTPTIAAGGTGLYRVSFSSVNADDAVVTVRVMASTNAGTVEAPGPIDLTVSGPRPYLFVHPDPVTHTETTVVSSTVQLLDGVITNRSDRTIGSIRVFIALYDGEGNLALIADGGPLTVAFHGTGPATLAPGETGTFVAPVGIPEYLAIRGTVNMKGYVDATPVP